VIALGKPWRGGKAAAGQRMGLVTWRSHWSRMTQWRELLERTAGTRAIDGGGAWTISVSTELSLPQSWADGEAGTLTARGIRSNTGGSQSPVDLSCLAKDLGTNDLLLLRAPISVSKVLR